MPITIGVALYSILGHFLFVQGRQKLMDYLTSYFSFQDWGKFIQYGLNTLLAIILYFTISWTFVLIVSIIASPFHEKISERVEFHLLGKNNNDISKPFLKQLISTLINETQKIFFIIFLSILVFILGLFPLLAPFSFIITSLLIAIQFLDYSWSRHNFPLSKCRRDLFGHLIANSLHGAGFLFLITVPILNLLILPFGVIYFTVLWTLHEEQKIKDYS